MTNPTTDAAQAAQADAALLATIQALRPALAQAAQAVYDGWEQDEDGFDIEFGGGGICDAVSRAMQDVLTDAGVAVTDGGAEGDDHAFTLAYAEEGAGEAVYVVDIPAAVYERGGGYSWTKIPGVTIEAGDVVVERAVVTRAEVIEGDEEEGW